MFRNKFDVYHHYRTRKSSADVTVTTNNNTTKITVLQYCREGARHKDQDE